MTRGFAATGRSGRRLARICASVALAGVFITAAESTQTAVANGDTRTLSFYHTHSKESLTVTFKKNGRYDQAALKKLNHFLRDWRNQKETNMEPRLFDVIWEVQKDAGSTAPIQIISAYRSPETNEKLRSRSKGVAKHSQHKLGRAMDIHMPDANMARVREAGLKLQRGGVGFYPSSHLPFVHLDVGNVRHWPRMSREQLVRLFPDGRTVHIPADGKPLKGYELALADVQRNGASVRPVNTDDSDAQQPRMSKGLLARLLGMDEDEETPASAPAPAAAPEAPVALAALDSGVPMPVARPEEMMNGGPQLAMAYAPQQLPAGPEMIWRSGADSVAGRAATSTTPGYGTDTTPAALVAPEKPQQVASIDPNVAPVAASLAPTGNLAGEREEAMRMLGMLREPPPVDEQPQPAATTNSRIAAAFDSLAPATPQPRPVGTMTAPQPVAPVAAPQPQQVAALADRPTPAVAYTPRRTARDRAMALNHPNFEYEGLIAAPVRLLPSSFGGNPNGTMRSDMFSGSPVPVMRTVYYGPQRAAFLVQ